MADEVAALVAQLHRGLLVRLSRAAGAPIQGLAQGARLLRAQLPTKMQRKLREVDVVAAYARHITQERNRQVMQ